MEHQRTISKIRTLKVGVMLFLLLFMYGIVMNVFLEMRQEKVLVGMKSKATQVLSTKYENDMSQAVRSCNIAFSYMKKSADSAILFSLIGFVFALYMIRFSLKQRTKVVVLMLFALGAGMIVSYLLSVGVLLPKSGDVKDVRNYMSWLYFPGYLLFGIGGLLFVYQAFKQVVIKE